MHPDGFQAQLKLDSESIDCAELTEVPAGLGETGQAHNVVNVAKKSKGRFIRIHYRMRISSMR